jgi:hypothetical protein
MLLKMDTLKALKNRLSEDDYKKIVKILATEYKEAMELTVAELEDYIEFINIVTVNNWEQLRNDVKANVLLNMQNNFQYCIDLKEGRAVNE